MRYHIIYAAEDPRIDRTHKYSKLCRSGSHRGRGQQPPDPTLVTGVDQYRMYQVSKVSTLLVYEVGVGDERSRKRGHLSCETAALQTTRCLQQ